MSITLNNQLALTRDEDPDRLNSELQAWGIEYELVEQMQLNIEFSSPGDFIPLPSQWTAHAKYIGRYGSVDVFYFDFYSLALSIDLTWPGKKKEHTGQQPLVMFP